MYFHKQSVIENSPVKPEPELHSEKTSTKNPSFSENNSKIDIKPIKTEHEESDSRLENQDLKNYEDPVKSASHEAHIPEDLENAIKKEEDCKPEFVFKCPFKPCPAFTIEEVSDYHQNLIRI